MVQSFEGNTWVAFIDISGFKQMMKNVKQAELALEKFYKNIFAEVFRINKTFPFDMHSTGRPSVNSVVVSDSAIFFIDNQGLAEDKIRDLHIMLELVKSVNLSLIDSVQKPQIMTTCAMDYGPFKYDNKSSNIHTAKSFFYGSTYITAYLGNEKLSKKPGFCRVLTSDFTIPDALKDFSPFNLLSRVSSVEESFDFYWMLNNPERIADFGNTYNNLTQSLYIQIAALLSAESKKNDFNKKVEGSV
jgi:hypothetical protein